VRWNALCIRPGWRNLFQSGTAQVHVKWTVEKLWFELATVTSQALKYDIVNYSICRSKLHHLWRRIDEPPEIQIGCYRGNSRSTASLGLIARFILTKCNHSMLACWVPEISTYFHSGWPYRCSVTLVTVHKNESEVLTITSLLSNVRHSNDNASWSSVCKAHSYSPSLWTIYRLFESILEMGTVHRLEFKSSVLCQGFPTCGTRTTRPVTRGGLAPLQTFSPPLEKCDVNSLKLLDIAQTIWTPLRKLFAQPAVLSWLGPMYH